MLGKRLTARTQRRGCWMKRRIAGRNIKLDLQLGFLRLRLPNNKVDLAM
jgi:hypothetical protein